MLKIKFLKWSGVLSLLMVFPLLSEAVTITNVRNDWLPKAVIQTPVNGYCRDLFWNPGDQEFRFIELKDGETVGYVIPDDEYICISFYYAALDTQRNVIGPVRGKDCEVTAYYQSAKIGKGCECTGEESRCVLDQ